MFAVPMAGEGAAPSTLILVGFACIAFGVFGLRRWTDPDARSEVDFVPRIETLLITVLLFGVASIVGGVAKA